MYIDLLVVELNKSGYACNLIRVFKRGLSCADDITISYPSIVGLNKIL